jgi:hypothetical protein
MRDNQEYNGWTNYSTWLVNLEIFDGTNLWENASAEFCKDLVEEQVEQESTGLSRGYARAFLDDVNWNEIADHLKAKEVL